MASAGEKLIERGIRQGSIISCRGLSKEAREAISECRAIRERRNKGVSEEQVLLVLSQDCDVGNPNLPSIEVLAVKTKKPKRGDYDLTKPRNYSKLMLPWEDNLLECKADLISVIPKETLSNEESLSIAGELDEKATRILVDWRVGCYKRIPFPDYFNKEFLNYLRGSESGLSDFLERNYENILDLFLLVIPADEECADCYDVTVTAVLTDNCSEQSEEEIRQSLTEHWKTLDQNSSRVNFPQVTDNWIHGQRDTLMEIVARPEDISLADLTQLKRFNSDFMCYPDDSPSDT